METSILSSTQRYAVGALFALALNQSQRHQYELSSTLPSLDQETVGDGMSGGAAPSSVSDRPYLWIHQDSGLLLPVLKFLQVEDKAWDGLKETAGSSSQIRHHVSAYLKLLEASAPSSSERGDKELALSKAVDTMVLSMEAPDATTFDSVEKQNDKHKACEMYCHSTSASVRGVEIVSNETMQRTASDMSGKEQLYNICGSETCEKPVEDGALISPQRKVVILYELLSACLLGTTAADKKNASQYVKGYDSRHRVALRLLATWLDVKWIKVEAMEIIVASSLMDLIKGEVEKRDGSDQWTQWKQGGMIGAAAVAGGTVMAVTGGVLAPAIAQGLVAMAPALGGILPGVGVGGFTAAAAAFGTASGHIAVGASFGAAGAGLCGSKMARRVGNVEDFEFQAIGQNHKQGRLAVGIMVSGLVFHEDDFVRPWDNQLVNLERYSLHWEKKNLVALSTAVQDLITSKITSQLMTLGATMTVLGTLMSALTLPAALLTASDAIDSKWAVALDRSDKAGKLLAEVLLEGQHGNRLLTWCPGGFQMPPASS